MPLQSDANHELEGGLFAYRGGSVIACSIVFIVLCTLSLLLRFVSHRIDRRLFNLEDWLMIPAWVLLMGLCANVICSVTFGGVGRHEDYILQYEPQAMESWALTLFVTELIYGILVPLEKTAILLLYLRLFRINAWFRITSYILLITVWMWGTSEFLIAIFQCKPIPYQWDKTIEGSCIDQISWYRWVRVPNAIHDVAMLVAPIPVVLKLQIALRQKLALSGIFILGSVGCVASFVSMALFFKLDAFSDATWASTQLMPWTLAEPGVIFICACLPALWPMVLRIRSRIGLSSNSRPLANSYGPLGTKGNNTAVSVSGGQPSHTTDDSIPLNNFGTHTPPSMMESIPSRNPIQDTHGGISVTKEFSWQENGEQKA